MKRRTHEEELAALMLMLGQMGVLEIGRKAAEPVVLPVIVDASRLEALEKCADSHSEQLRELSKPRTFWQRLRGR